MRPTTQNSKKITGYLVVFLWLVALHSFVAGLCLMFLPSGILNRFGFEVTERFFPTQAGVFHLVMVALYVFAIRRLHQCVDLVQLSIFIKFLAAIFLFSYYIFVHTIPVVLLSGAGDCLMGILMLYLLLKSGLVQNKNAGSPPA